MGYQYLFATANQTSFQFVRRNETPKKRIHHYLLGSTRKEIDISHFGQILYPARIVDKIDKARGKHI